MSKTSRTRQYSDADLLTHLKNLADDGTRPTLAEINDADGPCAKTYHNRFGGIAAAADRAGLAHPEYDYDREKKYSDEDLLGWIHSFVSLYGTVPSPRAFDDPESPTPASHTYAQRFGSWADAIREAGYEPRTGGGSDE